MATHRSPFVVTRRRLLVLPLALALPRRARASAEPATLSLDDFTRAAEPIARELVRDDSRTGQDAYLLRLASLAVRLGALPSRPLFALGKDAPGVELAPAYRGVPFFIIEWRLAPGAHLPAHDHPSYSVCTVGLDGEAEVTHFEPLPEGASRVRRTRSQLIAPGRVDTLSATRDNIHEFRAGPRGARGLDITTLHGRDHGFDWIDIAADAPLGAPVAARYRHVGG
jgi:hypothetical protein